MAATLVLQTVGTQDVQDEILDEFSNTALGAGARVNGRALGDWLVGLGEDELCEVISYRTLRNGPCYARVDASGAGWTLALLATDQPSGHDGDTIDIARAMRRWFALTRPGVVVLEPLVIRCAPNIANDELTQAMERLLVGVRDTEPFDHVVVLPQGGTPATRILLEHLAGRVFVGVGEIERLLPDGSGGWHSHSLLRVVEADFVARQSIRRLRDAITAGRYASARERAEDLVELGLVSDELVRWCDAGRRIVDDQPGWTHGLPSRDEATRRLRLTENPLGRLGAMIDIVHRLQDCGALRDALATYVTATELLSLAWCEEVAKVDASQLGQLRWTEIGECLCYVRPKASASTADRARHATMCASRRCTRCPLAADTTGQRILRAGGARAARAIRQDSKELVKLRNDVVHARRTPDLESELSAGIRKDVPKLHKRFAVVEPARATLSSLLADAALAAIGRRPPNPLALVDERLTALLK